MTMNETFRISRTINFEIPKDGVTLKKGETYFRGNAWNHDSVPGESFADAYPIIRINPHVIVNKEELGESWSDERNPFGANYYKEFDLSRSAYSLILQGRAIEELKVTYQLGGLPLATIPIIGEDASDLERITAKRNWQWEQPRKEITFHQTQYNFSDVYHNDEWRGIRGLLANYGSVDTYVPSIYFGSRHSQLAKEDWGINFLNGSIQAYKSVVSMRNIQPMHEQDITPTVPYYLGADTGLSIVVKETPWGGLDDDDWVLITGSYHDYFKVIPRRAIGLAT